MRSLSLASAKENAGEFSTSRRGALLLAIVAPTIAWPSSARDALPQSLSSRLDAGMLSLPADKFPSSTSGDLRYPSWLAGKWHVTTTARDFSMPLGRRYVVPSLVRVSQQDLATKRQLQYSMTFTDGAADGTNDGELTVQQSRAFNVIQEENAFTASRGSTVERGSYVCDQAHPHGRVLLDVRDDKPLGRESSTSGLDKYASWEVRNVVRSQLEFDITEAAWEVSTGDDSVTGDAFVTSELAVQRALFPSRTIDETFLEILMRFERPSVPPKAEATLAEPVQPTTVRARYRVAQYLSLPGVEPRLASTDAERNLARQAANRAVALLDYDLEMVKAE